jgi:hypothetical protein
MKFTLFSEKNLACEPEPEQWQCSLANSAPGLQQPDLPKKTVKFQKIKAKKVFFVLFCWPVFYWPWNPIQQGPQKKDGKEKTMI